MVIWILMSSPITRQFLHSSIKVVEQMKKICCAHETQWKMLRFRHHFYLRLSESWFTRNMIKQNNWIWFLKKKCKDTNICHFCFYTFLEQRPEFVCYSEFLLITTRKTISFTSPNHFFITISLCGFYFSLSSITLYSTLLQEWEMWCERRMTFFSMPYNAAPSR